MFIAGGFHSSKSITHLKFMARLFYFALDFMREIGSTLNEILLGSD
jgi:hypothetical protein